MAERRELPSFRDKRRVLFSERTPSERMRQTGQAFMEAGRYDDALEFFQRCGADDLTRQVAERAMGAGDTALYMRAKKILKEDISDGEWTRLAVRAEEVGAYSLAYLAHLRAGHDDEVARLLPLVPGMRPR